MWEDGGVVWSSDGAPFAVSRAKKRIGVREWTRNATGKKEQHAEKEAEKEGCGREQEMRTRRRDREEASLTRGTISRATVYRKVQKRMECWSRETYFNRTRSRHKVGEGGSK